MKSKVFRTLSWITILIVITVLFFIYISKSVAYAEGSWGWLPWNWTDGIGKSVQYGLYCITNKYKLCLDFLQLYIVGLLERCLFIIL